MRSFPDFEAEEGLRKEKRLRYAKVRALLKYCPPLQLPYFRRKFSLLHKIENSEFNLLLKFKSVPIGSDVNINQS